jgi:uncharacterized protein (TIGR02001 family)
MSLKTKITPALLAVSLGAAGTIAPVVANAEVKASIAASNFYLWRGQDVSLGHGAISGDIHYTHSSGLYTGMWTSSEGKSSDDAGNTTTEYDLYLGYGGKAGDLGYDFSVWSYNYPSLANSVTFSDASEFIATLSYSGVSGSVYKSLGGGDMYYTLGYTYEKFSAKVGMWQFDDDTANYSHLDLSYAATDELSFTISKIIDNNDAKSMDEDMLINVAWSKSFDL